MTTISNNLQRVHAAIQQACRASGRELASVQLLAVSKTWGAEAVRAAFADGQTGFGENYVQEAIDKIQALRPFALQWHLIGPLQSNKTRVVAEHFDWVQSIDRLKIAQRLNEHRPATLAALNVCIQVNVDGGTTKSGVAPGAAADLADAIARLPRLRLRGLMCIPEPAVDFEATCSVFQKARDLFDRMAQGRPDFDTLSMGMSADLAAAIHSGTTMVRVGTAIFGGRT